MKYSKIKYFQGECCPLQLVAGQPTDKLHCIICYQVMTKPVTLNCPASHTFGMACLKDWIKNKQHIACPYCRAASTSWTFSSELTIQLEKLVGACNFCNEWKGSLSQLQGHKDNCQSYLNYLKKQLEMILQQQLKQLDLEINPHLKEYHGQIYEKYVEDWKWLSCDMRDWKWWWWCSNPWWENKPCITCNALWHKYEKRIDLLELRRLNILSIIALRSAHHQEDVKQQN